MRSTHEQTVRCQNKCSYSGCVSWGVCTEISLMVISLGKHVDILEALSSAVALLYLFFVKNSIYCQQLHSGCRVSSVRCAQGVALKGSRSCYRILAIGNVCFRTLLGSSIAQLPGLCGAILPVCSYR